MSVDDNFQVSLDRLLIIVVMCQIFFCTAQRACQASDKHLEQFHLHCDVLRYVKHLVGNGRHRKTRHEKRHFEENKGEFTPLEKYLVEYVVNKPQSIILIT
jgi:hypothetical protein